MASFLTKLLLLGVVVSPAWAGSMAAWSTDYGPQVMLVNDTTNEIRYTTCNSKDEPTYSYDDSYAFDLWIKPKTGTPVTGQGWYNNEITIASIWYLDEQNNVTNALFNCNMTTGRFLNQGNWTITSGAPSVHPNSGLASVLLGATTGYRVYFHDNDGAINELYYTRDTPWQYRGIISQDINSLPALGAAFSGTENITVASPRDEQNIAATRWNNDESWFRTSLPHPLDGGFATAETIRSDIAVNETTPANFSLSAWDGKIKSIGITIDSAFTRSLWYIGNDSSLYQVANQNYTWSKRANQSNAFWPQADEPNADLAVAYDQKTSKVWLYYMVKGKLSEIKFVDNTWQAWSALGTPPPPQTTSSTQPLPTSSDVASDTGLSTGAKAGIGVGVSLGAIAAGAIIAIVVLARRKKQHAFEHPPDADEGSTTLGPDTPAPSYGSPAPAHVSGVQYDGWDQKDIPTQGYPSPPGQQVQQLDGTTRVEMDTSVRAEIDSTTRTEMYAPPQPIYELPQHSYSHELLAEPPQPKPEVPQQQH